MARQKSSQGSDDELLPPPRTARQRRARPSVPDDLQDPSDFDDVGPQMEEREPIPFRGEKLAEVERMHAKRALKKKPLFDFPEELPVQHRPYWTELVNSFEEGFFHPVDIPLMKMYCRAAHDVDRCNELIEKESDVVWGAKGPMVNPRVKARSISEAVLLNLTTKLRAQPASRGNSTEFQRNDQKAANKRQGDQVVDEDAELLLGYAERRGGSHSSLN